jgi:hypothetical protein
MFTIAHQFGLFAGLSAVLAAVLSELTAIHDRTVALGMGAFF